MSTMRRAPTAKSRARKRSRIRSRTKKKDPLYVDGKQLGPLTMISLGLIPNKKAHVTATVAGMLVDVRTGYIYGTTESTDTQEQIATVWDTEAAIEKARARAETNAFEGFVGEFEELWSGVVDVYKDGAVARRDEASGNRYHTIRLK